MFRYWSSKPNTIRPLLFILFWSQCFPCLRWRERWAIAAFYPPFIIPYLSWIKQILFSITNFLLILWAQSRIWYQSGEIHISCFVSPRSEPRSTPFHFDFSSSHLRFTIRCYESFHFRHRLCSIDSFGVLCNLSLSLSCDCSLDLAIFCLLIYLYVHRLSGSWFSISPLPSVRDFVMPPSYANVVNSTSTPPSSQHPVMAKQQHRFKIRIRILSTFTVRIMLVLLLSRKFNSTLFYIHNMYLYSLVYRFIH